MSSRLVDQNPTASVQCLVLFTPTRCKVSNHNLQAHETAIPANRTDFLLRRTARCDVAVAARNETTLFAVGSVTSDIAAIRRKRRRMDCQPGHTRCRLSPSLHPPHLDQCSGTRLQHHSHFCIANFRHRRELAAVSLVRRRRRRRHSHAETICAAKRLQAQSAILKP